MLGQWFFTADRYERSEDGMYSYVGRVDDMMKVGGLWVSPIDMEDALLEHPRVAGVGVIGVTEPASAGSPPTSSAPAIPATRCSPMSSGLGARSACAG